MNQFDTEVITPAEVSVLATLNNFVKTAVNPYENKPAWSSDATDFCYQANNLLGALDSFTGGLFRDNYCISILQNVFADAIKNNPSSAEKDFYAYSELMKLLLAVYNAQPLILHFSGVFEHLSAKVHLFNSDTNTAETN